MRHGAGKLMSLILVLLTLMGAMLLVTLGASAYSSIRKNTDASDSKRMSLGYVANKIASCDTAGCVRAEERFGLPTIVLIEEGLEECETLIYFFEGQLMEHFKLTESEIEPQYGTVLANLSAFDFDCSPDRIVLTATENSGAVSQMTVALMAKGE